MLHDDSGWIKEPLIGCEVKPSTSVEGIGDQVITMRELQLCMIMIGREMVNPSTGKREAFILEGDIPRLIKALKPVAVPA